MFLNRQFRKKNRIRTLIFIGIYNIFNLVHLAYFPEIFSEGSLIKGLQFIASMWTFYLDMCILLLYYLHCSVYKELFAKLAFYIKADLISRERSLSKRLSNLRICYHSLVYNYRIFNDYLNPALALWMLRANVI